MENLISTQKIKWKKAAVIGSFFYILSLYFLDKLSRFP
ncbi:hypothetical protein BSUBE1_1471 [Bacillus subtilis E1]|nr:hypothetical protein B4146_1666 [Bacillus subtilis]CCU58102.1 hypothetical protein BSUBE1_1471 [Bacillus subtilis E1]